MDAPCGDAIRCSKRLKVEVVLQGNVLFICFKGNGTAVRRAWT